MLRRNDKLLKYGHFDRYALSGPLPLLPFFIFTISLEKYVRRLFIFAFTSVSEKGRY